MSCTSVYQDPKRYLGPLGGDGVGAKKNPKDNDVTHLLSEISVGKVDGIFLKNGKFKNNFDCGI